MTGFKEVGQGSTVCSMRGLGLSSEEAVSLVSLLEPSPPWVCGEVIRQIGVCHFVTLGFDSKLDPSADSAFDCRRSRFECGGKKCRCLASFPYGYKIQAAEIALVQRCHEIQTAVVKGHESRRRTKEKRTALQQRSTRSSGLPCDRQGAHQTRQNTIVS